MKDSSSISSNIESDKSFSMSGKKRKRKNSDQISILLKHFNKNPKWDKETVENASKESGLSRSQAYKWGWDRRKKVVGGEGFDGPSKDEFGGYSKHDFTYTLTPITNILGIDLNQEILKLDLSPEPQGLQLAAKKKWINSPQIVEFSPIKKRVKKMREKEFENSSVGQEIIHNDFKSAKMVKNAQVQTPKESKYREEDYLTPVKAGKLLNLEEEEDSPRIRQSLFSKNSENLQNSSLKTERNKVSSENSFQKKSRSEVKSSDMK